MSKILSIGITSYKRVNELVRCINSIGTKYVDDIEILVSKIIHRSLLSSKPRLKR